MRLPPSTALDNITPKQREVLIALASSVTVKELAAKLNISPKGVEDCQARMQKNLGMSNLVAITRFAVREKLVSIDG